MPRIPTSTLVAMYRADQTPAAIGKAVGMNVKTVRARLTYAGIQLTGKGGRPRKLVAAVTAVLDEITEMQKETNR